MNELHQTILDAARDEVATRIKNDKIDFPIRDYKTFYKWCKATNNEELLYPVEQEAALLAMEKQASFWKWCIREELTLGVGQHEGQDVYCFPEGAVYTELELYEIFTTQQ